MASGSPAGRPNSSGAKGGFDFASDDILCSYDDFANQEASNGIHSDSVIGSGKDFHKSKPRSSAYTTTNVYTQPEDSVNQEVIVAVERTMKKYNDNLVRFLEGISSRLSQLELYCYNLDKSIGEMRTELQHDHGEADVKLKSLDKHLQEVHRSVQILRDKQELAETQKELAKLHLAQKESHLQEENVATPGSAKTKTDDLPEMHNLQLALALPNQIAPQPAIPARAPDQQQSITSAPPPMTQQAPYYLSASQLPTPSTQHQPQSQVQGSYVTADSQYQAPQLVQNPSPQAQQFPQYQQQQWTQQIPQPRPTQQQQQQQQQQQSVQSQAQIRATSSPLYYMSSQPPNPPQEALTSPMPMQVPMPGFPHQAVSRAEVMSFGPGGPLQTQPPPQHMKGGSYMIYESEGSRTPHFTQGGYHNPHPQPPPTSAQGGYHNPQPQPQPQPPLTSAQGGYHNPHPQPPPTSPGLVLRGPSLSSQPQFVRNHPYNELIDKMTSMGYRGDVVASIIQRLEETGQLVDFNAVLDRLNGHSSGGSQRSW